MPTQPDQSDSEPVVHTVRSRTIGYLVAALGLVAGLAWNDAISSAINALFPVDKSSLWAKFIYAAVITAAVVIASVYVSRLDGKPKNKK